MCHMLIFDKSKKKIVENFFDILFEFIKNPPLHPKH